MKAVTPKIVVVEHNSASIKGIHDELEKSEINFIAKIVQTEKEYKKAILNFRPDIILSHYSSHAFDGPAAFKIKNTMAPEIPFIFISESKGEETAIEWIKNGVSDFVPKENLSSLTVKVSRALQEANALSLKNERKQTEEKKIEELGNNEANFRAVFENSMDGLILMVTDGEILAANPSLCKILQKTEKEIIKEGKFAFIDTTDPRFKLFLEEHKRTGMAKGELTLVRKDGSLCPAELSSIVFTNANGQKNTSMIIRDISKLKQAEEKQIATSTELQQALNERNKIMDSSLDIICSFDEEERFVSVNAASESIWGYSPEELLGKKYIDLVFHDDLKSTLEEDIIIRNGVHETMFENRYIHKNGSIVPMLWSSRWDAKHKLLFCTGKDVTEKKSMSKAYDVEKQQFLDLYSKAPTIMVILKGPHYIFDMANAPYLKLINRTDIIGKTVKEVLPELEAQGIFNFLDTVYQTGETFTANEMLVKTDINGNGTLVDTYLNFIYQAHRNNEGIIDGIFFFAVDVTEQVLSRKKIEDSENRFRALVENSEEMIFLSTLAGEILYSSPSGMKMFGFSSEDRLNKRIFEFIHPDDIKECLEKRNKILGTPAASFHHQQRMLDKNGNWIWCDSTITNMLHEPGVHALVSNFRNITDKKILEQQQEFDRKNLSALINNTTDLIWSVNRDFKLITSNKPFKEMTTRILGEKMKNGTNLLASTFSPDILNTYKISCERAFAGMSFTEIEHRETPVEMWTEISYYPIRKDNKIVGTACYAKNITVQKQNELNLEKQNEELAVQNVEKENRAAELIIANKELAFQNEEKEHRAAELIGINTEILKTNSELDRFVYSVSHDLRSPLTSILGVLSFIEGESQEPDTLKHAKMIHKSINRLDEFIKNILSYSRNNRTALEVEIISPQQIAVEIVDALQDIKEAEGIHFEIEISEQQAFYSDRIRFNTILENLISNAIKYHQKDQLDRYIKITGQSAQDKLQLTIADNGIGIASEHHKKIFDMFFRLSGETDGSGIGLYIVKNTVKILQGSIAVESEEGKGTAFQITLKNLKP